MKLHQNRNSFRNDSHTKVRIRAWQTFRMALKIKLCLFLLDAFTSILKLPIQLILITKFRRALCIANLHKITVPQVY